ncbi:MAG TPA: DUF222 domain-containing protein [Nocardioides sp.]|jgi:hypothetical protein|nr:DUF222 domain-containing protein [Nocardioides sp.]
MDVADELDDMTGGELLDHVGDLAATQRRCEVEIFRAALQHAYLNNPDTLDPAEAAKPGREKARRRGGEGTPLVTDFAAAELGARLGVSMYSAWSLMADALDVCHRFPQLWARVEAGEVRVYLARLVARKTRDLTLEQAAVVDARVAEYADGRLPYSRFEALLDGLVAAADPEATAEAERKAAEQQWARPTRRDPATDHGMWGFYIKAPARVVLAFDAQLQRIADILGDLGDTDDVEKRRVKALVILSQPDQAARLFAAYQAWADRPDDPAGEPPPDPDQPDADTHPGPDSGPKPEIDWKALLPHVVVHLHAYAGPEGDGVARVEGVGPVTEAWVKEHLSPQAMVTVRPVLDIEGLAPVDGYEIPERHRRAVRLMTPADIFPYSSSLTPDQIDHTEPYRHGSRAVGAGQSRLGNYGPMSTLHHRLKTHGRWQVKQPFPGIYLWRDPYGEIYLVDHTGTRSLGRGRAA